MSCSITAFFGVSLLLSTRLAAAQPGEEKALPQAVPIVKNDAVPLPAGARMQLGKLPGSRYVGRPATGTLSADGKLLAVADLRDTIAIVNIHTGKPLHTLKGNAFAGGNVGMTFSADNSTLAIQTARDLTVWDVASGKQLRALENRGSGYIRHLAPSLSGDGKIVGAALDSFISKRPNGDVKAIEVGSGKVIGPFASVHNTNMRTAIARDGKTMLCWGTNSGNDNFAPNTIHIWDIAKSKELHRVFIFSTVTAVAYAPDGKSIVALTGAGNFHLIDVESGKEIRRFPGERALGDATLCYSPDGRRLVAYDSGGGLQAWEVADGTRIRLMNTPPTEVIGVAFPDKDRIVLLGMLGSALYWWDATDAHASYFEGHLSPVNAVAFTPDGKSVISGDGDHRLLWWDAATGQLQRRLTLPVNEKRSSDYRFPSLALAPDAKHAATYFHNGSRGVQLWDLRTGRAVRDFQGAGPFLEFSPDGTRLVMCGMHPRPSVWEVDTGEMLQTMPAEKEAWRLISRAAISPDGKTLAFCQLDASNWERGLILWDLIQKKELRRFNVAAGNTTPARYIPGVAFSADGKLIALGDGYGTILLLDSATGREWHKPIPAAPNGLPLCAFSPDGRFLATSESPVRANAGTPSDDPVVEIWEIASGHKRDQFKGHAAGITCLAFSPDGATIATGSVDTTVLLWDIAGKSANVAPFADSEFPAAWKSLAGNTGDISLTMRRLSRSPAFLAFLKQDLQPAKNLKFDAKTLAKLLADLDAADYKARELAARELKLLGERARAALTNGLAANPTLEARRRMQNLLDAMVLTPPTPAELQAIRGIEILERMATPAARAWLTALSRGDPLARTATEATAALKRIE